MSKPIAFIIGAGKNIGASTEKLLHARGYRVALGARSIESGQTGDDHLNMKINLTSPDAIKGAFSAIRQAWGEPNVVIYNAAAIHFAKPEVCSVTVDDFAEDLLVNTTNVYAAMREAVDGFKKLPDSVPRVFIATGNALNEGPLGNGSFLTLGVGKSATAHMIASASVGYVKQGYRFYYVDQRTDEGGPIFNGVDGDGHAEFFASLVDGADAVPWQATFVAGKGYTKFAKQE